MEEKSLNGSGIGWQGKKGIEWVITNIKIFQKVIRKITIVEAAENTYIYTYKII